MNTHTRHAPFSAGDLISERAARRATAHRRTAVGSETAPVPAHAPDITPPGSDQDPAGGARILRRWSVAELIARASAGTPLVA